MQFRLFSRRHVNPSTSKFSQPIRRAMIDPIESLERRMLLSVSNSVFIGPLDPGTQWSYLVTTAAGESATLLRRVIGPTTFNGNSCTEIDQGSSLQAKSFAGFDSQGNFVEYGDTTLIGGATQVDSYSPALIDYPAQMTAGVTYTSSATDTHTDGDNTDSSITNNQETLLSETPTSITVPLGTYDAYQITVVSTDTQINSDGTTGDPSTSTLNGWFVDGIGFVKESDSNGNSYQLTAFNSTQDHLVFSQQPPMKTASGTVLAPAITVSALDPSNNVDTAASDSVTLSLNSFLRAGTGTLGGTLTEPLVDGVATFSDLSVSTNGNYQLQATDTSGDTAATSNKFRIGSALTVEVISRAPGGTAGVKTGNIILYSVLVTPPLNETLQDQNLVVTFPAGFIPKGITAGGQPGVGTITWTTNTRVYNFDLTVPSATVMNGLKSVVVSGDDNVTYTDATTDEGTGSNTVKIALDNALDFVQNPVDISVNQDSAPTVTVAVNDIYGAVDTSSTDTIRLAVKKGPGAMTGTLTAQAVNGVATFSDLHFSKAADYVLMARDVSNTKIKAGISDTFAVVGLLTIEGSIGSQHHISHDAALDITSANVAAVPQSSGAVSLQGAGLSDRTADVLGAVKWDVARNAQDEVSSADPIVGADPSDPLQANLSLNEAEGSFNVICYFDSNKNGTYDAGEELRVFHLAEVAVVIQAGGSIVTSTASFYGKDYAGGKSSVSSGSFGGHHFAITSSETVQVVGGGADGMIGVDKIHVGWLQNGVGDSALVTYKNGRTKSETLKAGSFPILDSTYSGGRYLIYLLPPDALNPVPDSPGPTRDPVTGTDPNGGQDRRVATGDSPGVLFSTTYLRSPVVSTSGTNDFAEYLTAYSDDYSASYAAYNRVNWSAAFVFTRADDGTWTDAGSTMSESETDFGFGKLTDSLGIATTGPRFNKSVTVK